MLKFYEGRMTWKWYNEHIAPMEVEEMKLYNPKKVTGNSY